MPMEMRPPSKAGPAAVEAQSRRSRLPMTISPLVPRSIRAARDSLSCSRVARMPARMSLPTNPPRQGRKRTGVCRAGPSRDRPAENLHAGRSGSKGKCASGSRRCRRTGGASPYCRPAQRSSGRGGDDRRRASIMRPICGESAPCSLPRPPRRIDAAHEVAAVFGPAGSRRCGRPAVAGGQIESCATRVVVPRSTAMPRPSRGVKGRLIGQDRGFPLRRLRFSVGLPPCRGRPAASLPRFRRGQHLPLLLGPGGAGKDLTRSGSARVRRRGTRRRGQTTRPATPRRA